MSDDETTQKSIDIETISDPIQQRKLNNERFHYLKAILQADFLLKNSFYGTEHEQHVKRNSNGTISVDWEALKDAYRWDVIFTPYTDYKLKPFEALKLHPRMPGGIHPGDVEVYVDMFRGSWKDMQGGVLFVLGQEPHLRPFMNLYLHYLSQNKTSGMPEWDRLFNRLKAEGYPKGIVPCMFFGFPTGCKDPECEFFHGKEAVSEARRKVLSDRLETFKSPTPKQRMDAMRLARSKGDSMQLYNRLSTDFENGSHGIRGYCANPSCMLAWFKDDTEEKLKQCAKCKWTLYCSRKCQTTDWKRHKKDPCAPIAEMVENDDVWNSFGIRKGTGAFGGD